ncbi:MAG: DUF1697 domain-containing protein [Planctomycetes bacterium]|nr:DUF1697 domain-containing protein [Planctomycetota bacterium]
MGGKHILPMADLASMFAKAGALGIRTYIQSGNVVFEASPSDAPKIAWTVTESIGKKFKFEPTIVLRSAAEMTDVVANNPFLADGSEPAALYVGFLAKAPGKADIAKIDPARSPKDRLVVRGREIFVHYPDGVANSKFTNAYIDSTLATTSTFRNWRTVMKLHEMIKSSA